MGNSITMVRGPADTVAVRLQGMGINAAHFTNGAYAAPAMLVVPTVLAGFQFAVDQEPADSNPPDLIIAVNSHQSMVNALKKKNASAEQIAALDSEEVRARKVAEPVSLQFPDRRIAVVFYDEETPNKLYDAMRAADFGMESLFKWDFGTKPEAGVIEGSENFRRVRGHPLPNDIKPLFTDLTRKDGQKGVVTVVDLRGIYISSENKCLFPLLHPDLLIYAANGAGAKALSHPQPS